MSQSSGSPYGEFPAQDYGRGGTFMAFCSAGLSPLARVVILLLCKVMCTTLQVRRGAKSIFDIFQVTNVCIPSPWVGSLGCTFCFLNNSFGGRYRASDQGYGRGGTPFFTGVFEPLARVALYPTDEDGLGTWFGAA